MKLRKSLITLTLISALSACGGSSKNTVKPPTPTPVPEPTPIKTVIEGKAIKGTISNAIVTVYKYVDGVATKLEGDELAETSIITQEDGSYTITINDYDGAIKVELSVGDDTTMICDAPAGCGEVTFGNPISLASADPTLTLSAITLVGADNNGEANVNVSALTHLSAALIEADEDGVNAESIQQQSSIIANTFNITGSLTELEPTTIDSAAGVAGEDNFDELRYGLINSGIMSALFAGESENIGVLSGNLADAVNDLVANNGALLINQDLSNNSFELSLVDVLDGAGAAANAAAVAIAADPELAANSTIIAQLNQEEINLENQSEFALANADNSGRTAPTSEPPVIGDAIAKAKAMVDDIRLFTHLFEVGTDSNTAITGEGQEYITLIEDAGVMVEAEAASFLLLAEVADAVTELSMMHNAGTLTGTVFPINDYLSSVGAEGTITFIPETTNGGITFTLAATSGTEVVKLDVEAIIADDGKVVTLQFNGTIESTAAKLVLAEGSFAKVNLDSAVNRTSLEEGTFEGKISSGELQLEVTLEQKSTTTVPNPVKFSGLVKTKLIPVQTFVLDDSDSSNSDDSFKKVIETIILPEMLTLSGGFSSANGNVIKATLSANINDLESYQAPDFKYIGAPVADLMSVTFTDDKTKITTATTTKVENGYEHSLSFTAGNQAGAWSILSHKTYTDPDTSNSDDTVFIIRTPTTMNGFNTATEYQNGYPFAFIETVTGNDENQDGIAETYTWAGYSGKALNENGQLIKRDGTVHDLTDPDWGSATYGSYEELMRVHRMYPATLANAADIYAFEVVNFHNNEIVLTLADGSSATVLFTDELLASLVAGTASSFSGYINNNVLIEDAFTINVSTDSKTVIVTDATVTRTFNVDYVSEGNFVFDRQVSRDGELEVHDNRSFTTVDVGLDIPEIKMSRVISFDGNTGYLLARIIPVDTDDDNIADHFDRATTYSEFINADGVLVDANGNPIAEGRYYYTHNYTDTFGDWTIPFDPLAISNGLQAYKSWVTGVRGSTLYTYIDDIGNVDVFLTEADFDTLAQGETTSFDAYVTYPATTESLENKDVFLDVNAALSLETTLGDYQVNLMLSADRTALDDGKFDLAMQYKLPGEDTMRKFVVHMKTDNKGRLTANNSEGVLMVLKEPAADSQTNVIGTIVVGAAAEKVADIEDRDGIIMIVYSDDTVETL